MYAIIETGGKQYKASGGDVLFVERLDAADDEIITFKALAIGGGDDGLVLGNPYVDGAEITAKVIKNGKGKKITVFTYKPKKGSSKKMGHRQPYTKIQIESVSFGEGAGE